MMKRGVAVFAILIIIFGLFGCGQSMETLTAKGISYEIPTSWTREDSWHDVKYSSFEYNFLSFSYDYMKYDGSTTDKLNKEIDSIYGSSYRDSKVVKDDVNVDGQKGTAYSYYSYYDEDVEGTYLEGNVGFHVDVYVVYNDQLYRFSFRSIEEVDDESMASEKETLKIMRQTLKSVRFVAVDENSTEQ